MSSPLPDARRLTVALLALTLAAGAAPLPAQSLSSSRTAAGAIATSLPADGGLDRLSAAVADSVRRSATPWVLGGAGVGAVVGAVLTKSFSDDFCPESRPGYACSGTSTAEGAMIGAALGAFAGWVTWSMLPKVPKSSAYRRE